MLISCLVGPAVAFLICLIAIAVELLLVPGRGLPQLPALLTLAALCYFWGFIPATLAGVANGLIGRRVQRQRTRMALAPLTGALATLLFFGWFLAATRVDTAALLLFASVVLCGSVGSTFSVWVVSRMGRSRAM